MPPQEAASESEPALALVVKQAGKPQQVLNDFLHMFLNYQYGLSLLQAPDMIDGAAKLRQNVGVVRCAFVIQNRPITSRTTLTALSRGGQIPLFLLVPIRYLPALEELCANMKNIFFWDWERGASRKGPTLVKTIEAALQENSMGKLLDGIADIPYGAMRERVAQHVNRIDTLPALPELMIRIMKLVNDPDAKIDELETLLSSDPAIVWKLLEVMKSPTFAGTRKKEWNIHDIIMRLGLKKVGAIAQQIIMMNTLVKVGQSDFDLRRFWEHSLGCALIADNLVTSGSLPMVTPPKFNDYWLCTLLHDIGKFALGLFFYSHFEQVLKNLNVDDEFGRDFREAEAKIGHVGLHEEIGQLLMPQVDAGPEMVETVGNHHTGGKDPSPLTSLIHVSDNICKDMGMGYLKEEKASYSSTVLKSVGVEEEDLKEIKDAMEDSIVSEVRHLVAICLAEPPPEVAKAAEEASRKETLRQLSELLEEIETKLEAEASLDAKSREDLLVDIGNVRLQLTKSTINPAIVQALLEPLVEIDALSPLVAHMDELLEKVS